MQMDDGVGVDINLIPFPMIDRIEILKDGASAIYGADAIAGVFNIILIHKFRGLEIGGTYRNTNLGASNDARETEAWMKAGTGDDKTDILIIADAYDREAIFSRDRNLTSNGQRDTFWRRPDVRSSNSPGGILIRIRRRETSSYLRSETRRSNTALGSECPDESAVHSAYPFDGP